MNGQIVSVDEAYKEIQKLEADISELKAAEQKCSAARKLLESHVIEAKEGIKAVMKEDGLAELCGDLIRYTIQRSKPKLIITKEEEIPEEYWEEKKERVLRKDAILDQLKMGDVIPGCEIEDVFALKVGLK